MGKTRAQTSVTATKKVDPRDAEIAELKRERDMLLADREFLVDNLHATHQIIKRNESRKRILAQLNDLLDEHLFRNTVARRISEAAERFVDLGEICYAVFALMRELTPLRGAVAVVDIGDRRALVAE